MNIICIWYISFKREVKIRGTADVNSNVPCDIGTLKKIKATVEVFKVKAMREYFQDLNLTRTGENYHRISLYRTYGWLYDGYKYIILPFSNPFSWLKI